MGNPHEIKQGEGREGGRKEKLAGYLDAPIRKSKGKKRGD